MISLMQQELECRRLNMAVHDPNQARVHQFLCELCTWNQGNNHSLSDGSDLSRDKVKAKFSILFTN